MLQSLTRLAKIAMLVLMLLGNQSCSELRRRYKTLAAGYLPVTQIGQQDSKTSEQQSNSLLKIQLPSGLPGKNLLDYSVLLPPSYYSDLNRQYPVIYWLHGSAGSGRSLVPLSNRLNLAMRSGLLNESVVVFPETKPLSMWVNSKDGKFLAEDLLIDELIPFIEKTYRILSGRSHTSIGGFSMGGYGAARFGLMHPSKFGRIVMVGAGTLDETLNETPRANTFTKQQVLLEVYGGDEKYFYTQSPRNIAKVNSSKLQQLKPAVTIIVGTGDEVLAQNQRFAQYLKSIGLRPNLFIIQGVTHNLKNYIEFAEELIFQALGSSRTETTSDKAPTSLTTLRLLSDD